MKKYIELFQKPAYAWLYLALLAGLISGWALTCWNCENLTQNLINGSCGIFIIGWIVGLYMLGKEGWEQRKK